MATAQTPNEAAEGRAGVAAAAPAGVERLAFVSLANLEAWPDIAIVAAKRDLVREIMAEFHPKSVLDVGCNTGYLAAEAARAGARVVAIDSDPHVVGFAWRRADAEQLDLLPLVVDLTRPSPAQGWRNQECPSFLERARAAGGFDATFLFAVLHHMLVTERVPLGEVLAEARTSCHSRAGGLLSSFAPATRPAAHQTWPTRAAAQA